MRNDVYKKQVSICRKNLSKNSDHGILIPSMLHVSAKGALSASGEFWKYYANLCTNITTVSSMSHVATR
jgi:hypothetical protein